MLEGGAKLWAAWRFKHLSMDIDFLSMALGGKSEFYRENRLLLIVVACAAIYVSHSIWRLWTAKKIGRAGDAQQVPLPGGPESADSVVSTLPGSAPPSPCPDLVELLGVDAAASGEGLNYEDEMGAEGTQVSEAVHAADGSSGPIDLDPVPRDAVVVQGEEGKEVHRAEEGGQEPSCAEARSDPMMPAVATLSVKGAEEGRAEKEGKTVPEASSSPSGPVGPELFPAAAAEEEEEEEEEEEKGRGAGQGEGEQGLASPVAQARAALDRVVVVPPQVPNRADLCCPLTGELLLCPVRLADGSVYERAKIKEHLNLCHTAERPCISPRSGQELTSLVILPAADIKAQVQQYLRPQTV